MQKQPSERKVTALNYNQAKRIPSEVKAETVVLHTLPSVWLPLFLLDPPPDTTGVIRNYKEGSSDSPSSAAPPPVRGQNDQHRPTKQDLFSLVLSALCPRSLDLPGPPH
jgi:hypothetical protein